MTKISNGEAKILEGFLSLLLSYLKEDSKKPPSLESHVQYWKDFMEEAARD